MLFLSSCAPFTKHQNAYRLLKEEGGPGSRPLLGSGSTVTPFLSPAPYTPVNNRRTSALTPFQRFMIRSKVIAFLRSCSIGSALTKFMEGGHC